MSKLKELELIVQNSTLNSIFISLVKRAAHLIVANSQATEPMVEWAKRARCSDKGDRTPFYAGLVIEGELAESSDFRALIDAFKADPENAVMPEAPLFAIVDKWVARYAARNI